MFNEVRVEKEIAGRKLVIETGKIARQADGAVLVHYGETVVLVTAVTAPPRFDDIDFFPLSVDYRERHCAGGKFPGGFIKREGRPSTKEVLTARMIDRPIRPLFADGYFQEVQVMASVLSFDGVNDPDILAIVGASAALSISKIPFEGPIAACRLGRINGELVINPTYSQLVDSDINLLLGGQKEAINMIEVGSKQVTEEDMADAILTAHKTVIEICELIDELQAKVGVEKEIIITEIDPDLLSQIKDKFTAPLKEAKTIAGKLERNTAVNALRNEALSLHGPVELAENPEEAAKSGTPRFQKTMVKRAFEKVEKAVIRENLISGHRVDGRGFEDVRPIACEVGVLPRTHGSALFTRGETQALVMATLGTIRDAQIIDGLADEYAQSFMLHYNFPPFSVGEARPVRGPGRREIGHGALAERSLEAMRPDIEKFGYTIRLVSDITESNGSSSMASVCGGSLALMDAGVPLEHPVAGISVGLITDDQGNYKLLTDILGEEDHYGDMDFKVAGTIKGITGIQLDIKIRGLKKEILIETLERAKQARYKILDIMATALDKPRPELSEYAPKMISIMIDPEFIGKVIGPSGKMIKSIQEQTKATIEIQDDGTIFISCVDGDGHIKAKEIIEAMTSPPKVGKIYEKAKVVSVKDFGVFVEIVPGVEGLCHISELSDGYVKTVDSVCKNGDIIPVKLILVDDQGRLKLSRKAAMADLGLTDNVEGASSDASRPKRHDRRDRDNDKKQS
ncbi:MAG: polyribonucleotide nucleotidyltransferase [Phycisphaerae bacterium]|nr:polyribonucleotide nucleotidyltransferase [Phycisphaerae bacterium]